MEDVTSKQDQDQARKEFRVHRRKTARAALDLGYGQAVSEAVKAAKTVDDITNIMQAARRSRMR